MEDPQLPRQDVLMCMAPTFKGAYLRYQRTYILHRQPVYEALSPYKGSVIYHSMYPALPKH